MRQRNKAFDMAVDEVAGAGCTDSGIAGHRVTRPSTSAAAVMNRRMGNHLPLRLVAKVAMGYRGYGLPVGALISAGNIGTMQAVKRFDPARDCRLATYAMSWIHGRGHDQLLSPRGDLPRSLLGAV
jgi:hypothetical protein